MTSVFELQLARDFLFSACPPVYTLPGTWSKCNALIPHYNADTTLTFAISVTVVVLLGVCYVVYRSFFGNKDLTDPWDDHDD